MKSTFGNENRRSLNIKKFPYLGKQIPDFKYSQHKPAAWYFQNLNPFKRHLEGINGCKYQVTISRWYSFFFVSYVLCKSYKYLKNNDMYTLCVSYFPSIQRFMTLTKINQFRIKFKSSTRYFFQQITKPAIKMEINSFKRS